MVLPGKVSGVCDVQGELLKAGGYVTVKWLQGIYSMQVWSHETGEELSLYPFIRTEAGNCVKTTGGSAC